MRKLCWFSAPASAAIFLAVYLLQPDWLPPAAALCALGAVLARFLPGRARPRAALAAWGLAAGFLYAALYGVLFRAPAQALASQEEQRLTLTVTDWPSESTFGAGVAVKLALDGAADPRLILYTDAQALELRPGDIIEADVSLRLSDRYHGESSDYYPSRGIYLIGYAEEARLIRRPESVSPAFWASFAARTLKDSISSFFPADVSGFVTALITGDKRLLPTGLYAAFRRSGIAHVVAVSGLHVSFLASLFTTLLGKRSRLAALACIPAMFFFASLTGNSPSVLRAAFMQSLLLIAALTRREQDKPTTLSVVLLCVLLPCPYAAGSVGLQLSFAAVAGIHLLTGPLYSRWLGKLPRRQDILWRLAVKPAALFTLGTLATTAGAALLTYPLTSWYFRCVSLAGPLTNLLVLWAVSFVFLGGLLAALAGLLLPAAGCALAWAAAWPARWVIFAARGISRFPFAAISLSTVYLAGWSVLVYALAGICLARRGRDIRPAVPILVCLLTGCAALGMSAWNVLTGELTVSFLDVGQGSSTLFWSKGHSVLVDCGGNSANDPGDIAADALQALGTSRLDALVLTHCHEDHAGGVPELLSRLEVERLILPAPDPDDPLQQRLTALACACGCEVEFLTQDRSFSFGSASMELYAPLPGGETNEAGLSVLGGCPGLRVLVTGDMDASTERRLIRDKELPDIDVLLAGHHGARGSTSEELLLAVTPESAVISSGYNRYGHPAPETLERLGAAGCGVYLTRDMGTVTFTYREERSP